MEIKDIIDDVSGYISDAYEDLEPADFVDLAEDLRLEINKYRAKAQADITADIEAKQQERHEKQEAAAYRRALL